MSRRKKIFVLLLLFFILIIFVKSRGFSDFIPIDTATFNNKYSNGWYDFSFRYPNSATIQEPLDYPNQRKGDKVVSHKVDVREFPSGSSGSEPCSIEVYPVGSQFSPKIDNGKSIALGKNRWEKKIYISDPWSLLFRYKGVIWISEKNGYLYVGRSLQANERWCEAILSTVDFRADDSVEAAKQANNAKGVALLYLAQNYSGMKYKKGYFIVTAEGGGTSILDYTDSTIVEFAETPNTIRLETKALQLEKVGDRWVVIGETDSF